MPGFDFTLADEDAGTTYTPWTNGRAVGYQVRHPGGRVEFIYFNPSGGSGGAEDHTPNVFVYRGPAGDPDADEPRHFYDLGPAEEQADGEEVTVDFSEVHWLKVKVSRKDWEAVVAADAVDESSLLDDAAKSQPGSLVGVDGREIGKVEYPGGEGWPCPNR
jgi:hypothetical protein